MRWFAAILLSLLVAVPSIADDRWPTEGSGIQHLSREFFISDVTDYTGIIASYCIQSVKQTSFYNFNWGSGTVIPVDCSSSNNFEPTGTNFPAGYNVKLTAMVCYLTMAGATSGNTVGFRARWRNQGTQNQQTPVGASSAVVLTVGSGGISVYGSAPSIDGTVCPYASTGCTLAVNIQSTTLTSGTGVSASCTVFVDMSKAS